MTAKRDYYDVLGVERQDLYACVGTHGDAGVGGAKVEAYFKGHGFLFFTKGTKISNGFPRFGERLEPRMNVDILPHPYPSPPKN